MTETCPRHCITAGRACDCALELPILQNGSAGGPFRFADWMTMTNYPYQSVQQPVAPAYPLTPANPFADQAPNPYAAPQQPDLYSQSVPNKISPYAGLWREGNVMVMHKLAPLPDICLKSNQPAVGRLKRKLSWHHP